MRLPQRHVKCKSLTFWVGSHIRAWNEYQALKKELTMIKFKEPSDAELARYWSSVYNRTERSLGWILLCAGLVLTGAWGLTEILTALAKTDTLPFYVKGGIFVLAAGSLVLLISAIRERVYKRDRTRYKDVIR